MAKPTLFQARVTKPITPTIPCFFLSNSFTRLFARAVLPHPLARAIFSRHLSRVPRTTQVAGAAFAHAYSSTAYLFSPTSPIILQITNLPKTDAPCQIPSTSAVQHFFLCNFKHIGFIKFGIMQFINLR